MKTNLSNSEILKYKNALITLKATSAWKTYIEFEGAVLQRLIFDASQGDLSNENYAITKAYQQGLVSGIVKLESERNNLLHFKMENE